METRLARAYEGVLAMFHNEGRTTTVYNSLQQKTKTKHKTQQNTQQNWKQQQQQQHTLKI